MAAQISYISEWDLEDTSVAVPLPGNKLVSGDIIYDVWCKRVEELAIISSLFHSITILTFTWIAALP